MLLFLEKITNIRLVLLLILFDQITKYFAYCNMLPYFPFVHWSLVFNTGVSFGFASHLPVVIIISLQIMLWAYLLRSFQLPYFQILISAGFLSNLLDRFTYGGVLDFIHIHYSTLSFPFSFNIADFYISCAGIYLLFTTYKTPNSTGNIN